MVEDLAGSGAPRAFRVLAWLVLAVTVGVVISGDIVQATESGAGCGEGWPRCDGALVPGFEDAATGIEFAHRALTFALSVLVMGLVVAARRVFPAGHRIRSGVRYVLVFFVAEVLIGALLVRFGWVDEDASLGRVVADGLHLVNTFFLLGALALVAHYATGGRRVTVRLSSRAERLLAAGVVILLFVGITGAINSLADTLFPPDTILDGIREEFGPAAPLLVRVRAIHPLVAILGGVIVFVVARGVGEEAPGPSRRVARAVQAIIGVQFVLGVLNLALLTPLETQVVHLLTADLLWISYLFLWWRFVAGTSPVTRRRREAVAGAVS